MADKNNVIECLVKVQHLQRIAKYCEIAIRSKVNCEVNVELITPTKEKFIFFFLLENTFTENAEVLQDFENLFNIYEDTND